MDRSTLLKLSSFGAAALLASCDSHVREFSEEGATRLSGNTDLGFDGTAYANEVQRNTTALLGSVTFASGADAKILKAPFLGQDRYWLSERIHKMIAEKSKEKALGDMKPYEETFPLCDGAKMRMVVVPGGEVTLTAEDGSKKTVKVDPFWMAEIEMTWGIYNYFWQNGKSRLKNGVLEEEDRDSMTPAELVTQPTQQYNDMLRGTHSGDDEFPAMDMTNHAASKFCQWISAQTGRFYRLPTEAEWEFAARGGATTKYFWGDDPDQADEYAWFEDNANLTYQVGKQKKPNKYGLYDMLGNLAEWTLDAHAENSFSKFEDGEANPWNIPTKRYPRSIRGGSFEDGVDGIGCSARFGSDAGLKEEDPQVPKSIWYHTWGQHIGFRIVRPLRVPGAKAMHTLWNTDESSAARNAEDLDTGQ